MGSFRVSVKKVCGLMLNCTTNNCKETYKQIQRSVLAALEKVRLRVLWQYPHPTKMRFCLVLCTREGLADNILTDMIFGESMPPGDESASGEPTGVFSGSSY